MTSEWQAFQLDDLCEFTNGFAFKSTDYVEKTVDTIEVFRMGYICRGGGFKEDATPVFVPKAYGKNLDKFILRSGDVVIAMTDMKDKVAILGNTARICYDNRFVLNQRVGCLRVKRHDLLDPDFLYFYSNSAPHVNYLRSRANSGVQVNLSTSAIKESQILIPSLSEQKKIAAILVAIDDRITLLRETNQTLEAIAQALFKSWFVDFDPVRAKAEGRLPEGIDSATAELFPNAFEASELGLVPKGWEVKKFGEFIERLSVGKKFDQKTALTEGAVPILDQGKSGIIGFHNEAAGVKASLENPVVVFANHTCYMRLICFDFSAIQNVLPFIGKQVDTIWAYYATRDRIKFSEYKGHWPDFAIEKAVVPPEVLTKLYKDAVSPIVHRIRLNELQANTLSNLRDTLLPRLISGQLRIADAEAELEKATA